jgi:hypothetical protein
VQATPTHLKDASNSGQGWNNKLFKEALMDHPRRPCNKRLALVPRLTDCAAWRC